MSIQKRKKRRKQRRDDIRYRREMGATIPNMLRIARDMKEDDPVGFKALSPKERANAVMEVLVKESPHALFDGDRDWAGFFKRLLEFVFAILAKFGF